jgi:glycerophosphoryl diester phosphodiesterase
MEEFGFNIARERLVKAANEHNIAVHFFTIDDEDEMNTLIDIGADGIMTDNPTTIDEVYRKREN